MMRCLVCLLAFLSFSNGELEEGSTKWEQDLSNNMKIGLATGGYSKAVLECGSDWMAFVVSTEKEFHGVVYAKGTFYQKQSPCFFDANGGTDFALKIPYDDTTCSKYDSSVGGHITTVIVQHDKDLITPGDLAFTLQCRDEFKVEASVEGMRSQITVVDADPTTIETKIATDGHLQAMSPTNIVVLTPPKIKLDLGNKEEL